MLFRLLHIRTLNFELLVVMRKTSKSLRDPCSVDYFKCVSAERLAAIGRFVHVVGRVCCTVPYKDEHKVIFRACAIEVGFQLRIIIYTYATKNKNEVIAGRSVNSWIQALWVVMFCGMYLNRPFVLVFGDIYK
jgi:hypothetical protein